MDYALWLLGRKQYTVAEIRERFARRKTWRGCELPTVAEINAVIARLRELGYLDDALYARNFIETRTRLRPKGVFGLRTELLRKGIAMEIAREALDAAAIDEEVLALEALSRKRRGFTGDRRQVWQKKARFLASRGFSPETISRVLL